MRRADVIQALLQRHESPRYLEVGVHSGDTFHNVRAASKVAVDPAFRFAVSEPRVSDAVSYHEVQSDAFFADLSPEARFDVIFLDGLHTSEQTLRDLMNAIAHLAPGGAIVVDDIRPDTYASSLVRAEDAAFLRQMLSREAQDQAWMGDVYRLAFFVEAFLPMFSYATVAETNGQMVLWAEKRSTLVDPGRTIEWIGRVDFLTLLRQSSILRLQPLADILSAYDAARA